MENNTVKNEPITQTLFRFVSLRNPQLADEDTKNLRFVEKTVANGYFATAVNNRAQGVSKITAMMNAAKTFTALTEGNLKSSFPQLYKFAVWLTRNKSNASIEEINSNQGALVELDNQTSLTLWDNLIYQVLTQKEFYAKEVIMQLLLANHLIKNNNINNTESSNENILKIVLNATVVLPKDLFVEEVSTAITQLTELESVVNPSNPTTFMQKQQELLLAKQNIKELELLQAEVNVIEKNYNKNYLEALEQYEAQYNANVKSVLADYNATLSASAEDDANNTQGVAEASLQSNKVPLPELPEFNFDYTQEVEASIQNKFTATALNGFLKLPQVNSLQTFAELKTAIGNAIQENNSIIIQNTETGQKVVSIGGVLLNESALKNTTPFEYQVCPKPVGQGIHNFDIAFDVPDSSWDVSSMTYQFKNGNGITDIGQYYQKTNTGNTILLANLFYDGINISATQMQELSGEILFTNGIRLSFLIKATNFQQCFTGKLTGQGNNGGGTVVVPADSFIPEGFGYKQIGIADYKKVEQSVHSYVEGEVAHIENIMAKEYKEKSTRRLRRNETTTTQSSESEKEQLTDTNSANRFELQSEIAKQLQESKDKSGHASVNASAFGVTLNAGANFATHSSKEESTRQAITEAKEITQRALDRLVTKVKEERVEKIIEEYEENNKHGFDNREGDKHVTGVYRWVDKLMKNRIVNFGKRLMFEFMVPQPAKLHTLGLKEETVATVTTLVKPEDPRTSNNYFRITDYSQITEASAKYWAGKLNAEITPMPTLEKYLGTSLESYSPTGHKGASKKDEIKLPDGYVANKASVSFSGAPSGIHKDNWGASMYAVVGDKVFLGYREAKLEYPFIAINNFTGTVPVSFSQVGRHTTKANITVGCSLSNEAKAKWQQETFTEIITAYNAELLRYNEALEGEKQKVEQVKTDNPLYYRQIENTILRKNCISYLIDKNANATKTYGKTMHNNSNSFSSYEIENTTSLDNYTSFAKFLEQAFEWEVMSYHLYPFYWGGKQDWLKMYQNDNADPIFRNFLQSGMARIIVTVRPGFEAAVQHYMSTGKIWNGGQIPVIGDPLYLSLTDELKEPTGKPEGKAWLTRIPTVLTILQADSIGLKVDKALPQITDDIMDFEDPSQVPVESNFELTNAKMEAPAATPGG